MKNTELTEEPPVLNAVQNVRKRQPNRSEEKVVLELEDVSREHRKREARKPLYLVRYE
jgi:hypothetical protein